MSPLDLLAELEGAVQTSPDEVDPAELEVLCQALRAAPEAIPRARAAEVVERLSLLADWARDRSVAMGEELRTLGDGRRAMRGYGSLRSAHTAQRLFKRV